MLAKLVECSDHRQIYGILRVEDKDWATVQNEIYKIKERFAEEGFNDWYLADVFKYNKYHKCINNTSKN